MSEPTVKFRRELTEKFADAAAETVAYGARVSYYEKLLQFISSGRPAMTAQQVDGETTRVVAEAKGITRRFNDLYVEFSRVSIRPAAELYRVEAPPHVQRLRPFSVPQYLFAIISGFLLALVAAAIGAVIHHRLRQVTATDDPIGVA